MSWCTRAGEGLGTRLVMYNKQDLDMHKISPQHITMYNYCMQLGPGGPALHHVLSCTRSSAGHVYTRNDDSDQ